MNDSELIKYNDSVRDYLLEELTKDERIRLYGVPRGTNEEKIPLFSFTVEGVHHEDLALILDKMGIAVRSGQMCAEPVMDRFGVTGMLRASVAPYNTMEEAEYFVIPDPIGDLLHILSCHLSDLCNHRHQSVRPCRRKILLKTYLLDY